LGLDLSQGCSCGAVLGRELTMALSLVLVFLCGVRHGRPAAATPARLGGRRRGRIVLGSVGVALLVLVLSHRVVLRRAHVVGLRARICRASGKDYGQ
jgi:hypothetical protein